MLEHAANLRWALVAIVLAFSAGCASLTNPVADGVPVRRVPEELLATSRKVECSIPLQLLRQPTPDVYRLAPGDVLAIVVDGFLGNAQQQLPINSPGLTLSRDQRRLPPTTGYPVPVNDDGTINLPIVGPIPVAGKTIMEAREAVWQRYVTRELLKPETANVIVSLLQPRQYAILVLRQEAANFGYGNNGLYASSKRGTGYEIELLAYENDVAHALARSGGLPGLDACNEVIVHKQAFLTPQDRAAILGALGNVPAHCNPLHALHLPGRVVKIPLRTPHGKPPPINPEDITLENGDIVYIEACDSNVFYTGGLLPAGEYQLPRERDMDVLEAIAFVRGPLINGSFGGNNLSGTLIQSGIGNPSPTLLTVVRRTPGGGQIPIVVDLGTALRDSRERLLIKPGDLLILQEKPSEAMTRYVTQTLVNFNLVWEVVRSKTAAGILDISAADRLSGRLPTVNFDRP